MSNPRNPIPAHSAGSGTWAWTADYRYLWVPDHEFTELLPGCTAEPLRGSAFTQAVFSPIGRCIGWILTETIDPDAQCPEHGCSKWRCTEDHP